MEERISRLLHLNVTRHCRDLHFVDELTTTKDSDWRWLGHTHVTLLKPLHSLLADIMSNAPLEFLVYVSRILRYFIWGAIVDCKTLHTLQLECNLGSTANDW